MSRESVVIADPDTVRRERARIEFVGPHQTDSRMAVRVRLLMPTNRRLEEGLVRSERFHARHPSWILREVEALAMAASA